VRLGRSHSDDAQRLSLRDLDGRAIAAIGILRDMRTGQGQGGGRSRQPRKSQFLANVSHESGTPLNAIICIPNCFRKRRPSKGWTGSPDLNKVMRPPSTCRVINDVLDLAKIESGKLELLWRHSTWRA
jgi:signal transduction histidine kinase